MSTEHQPGQGSAPVNPVQDVVPTPPPVVADAAPASSEPVADAPRVRLNPTADPGQFKAIPSLNPGESARVDIDAQVEQQVAREEQNKNEAPPPLSLIHI